MSVRTLAITLLLLPCLTIAAQTSIPSLLLLVKEKVRPGKMVPYDTNESRIAATCARMRCPHAYVALKSTSAPDEIWWLNEFLSSAEKSAVDKEWQSHPAMRTLRPLAARKDSLRTVVQTTLLRRTAEASPGAPWSIAGT